MLTFEDCLAFTDLTPEEIDAVAEHEHIPEMLALEFGRYLCETQSGERRLRAMILDDIEAARTRGDLAQAAKLRMVLKHFVETHPRAEAEPA